MKRRLRAYKKTVSIVNEKAIELYKGLGIEKKGFLLEGTDKESGQYTFMGVEPNELSRRIFLSFLSSIYSYLVFLQIKKDTVIGVLVSQNNYAILKKIAIFLYFWNIIYDLTRINV